MSQDQTTKEIKQLIIGLRLGNGMYFKCSGEQPFNRIFYQRVNAAAYALWGPGAYKMMSGKGEVGVIRRSQPRIGRQYEIAAKEANRVQP